MGAPEKPGKDFELGLMEALLQDCCYCYPNSVRLFRRDVVTLRSRVASEGLQFLSHALAALGKAVDRSFEIGRFTCPTHFKKYKQSSLPAFLRGLFREVYCEDGSLRPESDATAVGLIRQVCYCFAKYRLPSPKRAEEAAIRSFLNCNESCGVDRLSGLHTAEFTAVLVNARSIVTDIFGRFNPSEITPRHGPGAVATGEKGDAKMRFSRYYSALADVFPYTEYFFVNDRHISDLPTAVHRISKVWTSTSKMCLVPKDYRGPRVINEEPLEVQWIQQGLRLAMYRHLETHPLTKQRVNFVSQDINRELARKGSKDSSIATLDMKDASNRVSLWLVRALYAGVPELLKALEATRSTAVDLPNGETIRLSMFAPMGSAVCFPVEAIVFYALAVSAIAYEENIPHYRAAEMVHVYGDDLAIDTPVVKHVLRHLPRYNLLFNRDKCFTTGPFRESCGLDAFKGEEVTPIRLKEVWKCNEKLQGNQLLSYVETSNGFYKHGCWSAASYLRSSVERQSRMKLPRVGFTSGCILAWRSFIPGPLIAPRTAKRRWSSSLQKIEHYLPTVKVRTTRSTLDGWEAVLRFLTTGGQLPSAVTDGAAVKTYRAWTTVE